MTPDSTMGPKEPGNEDDSVMAKRRQEKARKEGKKKRKNEVPHTGKQNEEPLLFFSKSKAPFNMLSNFYEVDIEMPEGMFPSVEHYFQATKFVPPDRDRFKKGNDFDKHVKGKIVNAVSKGRFAKSAGSKAGSARHNLKLANDAFEHPKAKLRMKAALSEKFKQEPFRRVLLDTGSRQLVHIGMRGNLDFWTGKKDKSTGEIVGENTMGKLLMEVREKIIGMDGEGTLQARTST